MKEKMSWEERVATFEPCEAEWAEAKSKSRDYPRNWMEFKEWLNDPDRVSRYFPELKEQSEIKGSDILRIRAKDMELHRDNPDRWRFEDIAKAYYRSLYENKDYPSGTVSVRMLEDLGWGDGFGKNKGKDIPLVMTVNRADDSVTIRRKHA